MPYQDIQAWKILTKKSKKKNNLPGYCQCWLGKLINERKTDQNSVKKFQSLNPKVNLRFKLEKDSLPGLHPPNHMLQSLRNQHFLGLNLAYQHQPSWRLNELRTDQIIRRIKNHSQFSEKEKVCCRAWTCHLQRTHHQQYQKVHLRKHQSVQPNSSQKIRRKISWNKKNPSLLKKI